MFRIHNEVLKHFKKLIYIIIIYLFIFLQYYIKRGHVVIIYDEKRQHVQEDLKHADTFIKKLLGDQPTAVEKTYIKATTSEVTF